MKFTDLFSIITIEEVQSLTDDKLKTRRNAALWKIIYVVVPAFVLIEIALWYGYDTSWKIILLLSVLYLIPQLISTSRLSEEYFSRKKDD